MRTCQPLHMGYRHVQVKKRWFQCASCGHRTASVARRFPAWRCDRCRMQDWKPCSMYIIGKVCSYSQFATAMRHRVACNMLHRCQCRVDPPAHQWMTGHSACIPGCLEQYAVPRSITTGHSACIPDYLAAVHGA